MRRLKLFAGSAIAVTAFLVLMALTGPRPDAEITGILRRAGGACLELEKWGLFGWRSTHQSYSVTDVVNAEWHQPPVDEPPCISVDEATYQIRLPLDSKPGVYRICGLDDERACDEFRLVPFTPGEPGP